MSEAGARIHHLIRWSLGDGSCNFWEDIWLDDQTISSLCNPPSRRPFAKVRDFWTNHQWSKERLEMVLSPIGVPQQYIEDICQIPFETGAKDVMWWTPSPHGTFATSSAWDFVRHHNPALHTFKLIWNDKISPSISILVWRLLFNRVPVDTKLQWRNIYLASKCRCCASPNIESREHLFVNGDTALRIWSFFEGWFPKAPTWDRSISDVAARLQWWHQAHRQAPTDHASAIVPCLIFWSIWSERNDVIHNGTRFRADNVINRVKLHLQRLEKGGKLSASLWLGCRAPLDGYRKRTPQRTTLGNKKIAWIPPKPPWIKINTDGAFSSRNNRGGGGGVARDAEGNLIKGFWINLNVSSGMEAGLETLLQGVALAKDLGRSVWLEVDDKLIAAMAGGTRRGPANLRHKITKLRMELGDLDYSITHIGRGGNKVSDWLASHGSKRQGFAWFGIDTMPVEALILLQQDQQHLLDPSSALAD